MVGVPLDRYVGLAFGLVGALAVVIAVAAAPSGPFSVTTGALLGVKGLAAAVVIGFGSPLARSSPASCSESSSRESGAASCSVTASGRPTGKCCRSCSRFVVLAFKAQGPTGRRPLSTVADAFGGARARCARRVARRADRARRPRRTCRRAALVRAGLGPHRRSRGVALPRALRDRARADRRARGTAVSRPGRIHERRLLRDRAPSGPGGLAGLGDGPGRRRVRPARAACGLVLVRLPPLFLAVSTWLLSWLVLLVAAEFPDVAGGSQGYVLTSDLSASGHYELALLLTAAGVAGLSAAAGAATLGIQPAGASRPSGCRRGPPAACRPAGSCSAGIGAFVASAAVGGLGRVAGRPARRLSPTQTRSARSPRSSCSPPSCSAAPRMPAPASWASGSSAWWRWSDMPGPRLQGRRACAASADAGQHGHPAAILALGGDGVIPFVLPPTARAGTAPSPPPPRPWPWPRPGQLPPSALPAGSGSRTAACTRWPVSTSRSHGARRLRSSVRTAPGRPRRSGRSPVRSRSTGARSRSTGGRSRDRSRRCSPRPGSFGRSSRRPRFDAYCARERARRRRAARPVERRAAHDCLDPQSSCRDQGPRAEPRSRR